MENETSSVSRLQIASAVTSLFGVLLGGTVFFRFIEGWSWVDSYFFTVITLSTVGYGDLVPATPIGRIGATVLIFAGLGVFAYAIQLFATIRVERQKRLLQHRRRNARQVGQADEPSRTPENPV